MWIKRISNRFLNVFQLVILCCFIFVFAFYRRTEESIEKEPLISIGEDGFFVNTSGCRISSMKPLSDFALSFMEPFEPIICPMVQLMIAETIEGRNYLVRNISKSGLLSCCRVRLLRQVTCIYREFFRVDDSNNKYISLEYFLLDSRSRYLEVGTGQQNIRIWCWVDFARIIFHDVLYFLPPPKNASKASSLQERLSVMILGVDSISHMHYLRYFHRVADFIEHLPHTEFWGYNRIGLNTYPNLMPLLSGLSVSEIEQSCYDGRPNFDDCHFLWDDFKKAGYTTVYGEDTDIFGLFIYRKRGFSKQPTDIYMRPVMPEIESHTMYRTKLDLKCTGNRLYGEVFYQFILNLIPYMQHVPLFSFFWNMHGVHDYFPFAKLVDKDYLNILRELYEKGVMEHTLILFMGDHGLRFDKFARSAPGRREMSQPLLIAIYPEWLKRRFPLAMSNFQENARSLITTFDLHETLKDVIHLDRLGDDNVEIRTRCLNNSRGISLFLPIPDRRTCQSAEIPSHYCLCNELTAVSTYNSAVQEAARFAVARINELIEPYPQCQKLQLKKVRTAYGSRDESKGRHELSQIMVRLMTVPGSGNFDATILVTEIGEKGTLKLGGPITRTDKYGHQSYCVQNYRIEMYCYCL
ncbi:uncharacterized protein LOC108092406 [Drosophila ficusphila]|uniref:uncharacterized protein LOC108092406 n=1 Tax=Drosophila ficusphila TaxID=30025 RepID=UPI0007E74BD6|nr:uncharacterized protein LOC108092406 [Drosophila ficusphila]